MTTAFSMPVRVYYEDTDSGGVVYYANYLRFLERARTEWLRNLGFEQQELSRDPGVVFAVRSVTIDFLKPARLDDLLEVTLQVRRAARASFTVGQQVRRSDELLCDAQVRVACIDARRFVPTAIPNEILARVGIPGGVK